MGIKSIYSWQRFICNCFWWWNFESVGCERT